MKSRARLCARRAPKYLHQQNLPFITFWIWSGHVLGFRARTRARTLMMRATLFLEQDDHLDYFIAILAQNLKRKFCCTRTKKYIFGSLHDKKWNYSFNAKMKSWLDMRKQYSTWVSSFFLKKEIPFAFLVAIIAQKANFYASWSLIIFWNHQCFEIKIWNCFDFTNILSKQTNFLLLQE